MSTPESMRAWTVWVAVVLAVALAPGSHAGIAAAGSHAGIAAAGNHAGTAATGNRAGVTDLSARAQDDVNIDIDCEANRVRVVAPDSFGYTLRVSNVLVTPDRSEVLTTTTTESGNASVSLTESGPVYVFVSDDAGLVGSAFENCGLSQRAPNATTATPTPAAASVDVDCNASEVAVTAPAGFTYNLRVSSIVATPQNTQVFTTVRTADGNSSIDVGDAGAVSVFVSNETGVVTSAFANCEYVERGTPNASDATSRVDRG